LTKCNDHQGRAGRRDDRAVVAIYLLGRGIDTAPANVLLASGTQQALDTVLRALTRPDDVLAAEALSYPGTGTPTAHCDRTPDRPD
jgi:DNA-binding transcriptional MocR family regulator